MNKIIIVGATSGIGKELALIYIKKGWRVGIAGRRQDLLSSFVNEYPTQVVAMQMDITQSDAPEKLEKLIENLGGMDIYFHSSGVGFQNPNLDASIELKTGQTNVIGFMQMVDTAYHYFKNKRGGHIAVISSIAGTKGLGVAPAYSATKRFQNTYIEALSQLSKMDKSGVSFTDIKPGFVDTNLLSGGGSYPLLMQPRKVALVIEKVLRRKQNRVIIDWKYKILVFFWRLIPSLLWRNLPVKNK